MLSWILDEREIFAAKALGKKRQGLFIHKKWQHCLKAFKSDVLS